MLSPRKTPLTPRKRPGKSKATLKDAQREATQSAILQAALASFSEHGFDGSSTRDIAAMAKVHHALIKYHFKTKEALWQAAVEFLFVRQDQELRAEAQASPMRTARDRREAVRAALRHYILYCARHPEHARIMMQESMRETPRLLWVTDKYISGAADSARHFIRALKRETPFADVSDLALNYMIAGAAQSLYTLAPEVKRVWGADPADPKIINDHIDAMLKVFVP